MNYQDNKSSFTYIKSFLKKIKNTFFVSTPAECCGIVGYIGSSNAESILLDGIHILQNRGYDSCGITTISPQGSLVTTKFSSKGTTSDCINLLVEKCHSEKKHTNHSIGIGHTRWATHGPKTDINAHPHCDHLNQLSVVHNGTIDNYSLLRKRLQENNIAFKSETDTEVIANLISWYLERGWQFESAVQAACKELQGTWGLAIIHKDHPNEIVLSRNGSPLLIGITEREVFIASEVAALASYTNEFCALRDGETCVVKVCGCQHLKSIQEKESIQLESFTKISAPYEHWTLREIFEQPHSLRRAINYGGRLSLINNTFKLGGLERALDRMLEIKNLVLTGCGTSLHAGMYGERLMRHLKCFDVIFSVDSSEFNKDFLPKNDGGVLLLSQSGETLDVIRAYQIVSAHTNFHCFSVINAVGSHLARLTDCGVYLNAGREVGVASTKAFTAQVTVLALISGWYSQHRGTCVEKRRSLINEICQLPSSFETVLELLPCIRELAQKLCKTEFMFILGKGYGHAVALEGALKIKEITYIHAEGYAAGALKHGPFALIDEEKKTPVIIIIPSDEHLCALHNAAEQVKARGAFVIGIVDNLDERLSSVLNEHIIIPSLGHLTCLLAAGVLQMLAYELAVARGLDPDKPRGLAKTVTVL